MSKHTSVVSDSMCHAEIIKVWIILEYKIHHNNEFLNGIPRVNELCLLPVVDSMLETHLIYARKWRKTAQEERVNDKCEHLFVSLVLSLLVLFRVSISSEVHSHCSSIILLIEPDNVDSEPSPAAVDVQATVSVINEPLVLHLLRNNSLLDFCHLFLGMR